MPSYAFPDRYVAAAAVLLTTVVLPPPAAAKRADAAKRHPAAKSTTGLNFSAAFPFDWCVADKKGKGPPSKFQIFLEESLVRVLIGEEPANWKVVAENYLDGYHIPIAHPALVRLLDYKRYEADIHDHWVWFEAPHREEPTDNWIVRLYSKIVQPMPGLSADDLRVWRYVFIYPNTILDIYPDQMNTWVIRPTGVDSSHDHYECYRPVHNSLRTRVAQRLNLRLNTIVAHEDIDLVRNVQTGLGTRDYECGPLSERDAALAWFADRIRGDLGL